jgi:Na+-transporting NADH:ubiquinone oxidoreductase subunit B
MKFLLRLSESAGGLFQKGKPLAPLHPLYEATETFLFSPGQETSGGPHIRDALDLKRLMSIVIVSLIPCILMAIYNTGYHILLATGRPTLLIDCLLEGAFKVLPIIVVSYAVGGFWEALFAVTRKHEINEGFLVTGMLFPLTLPPAVPLWQVAVGISFGVVIGKEIFGGTGMNILNPALVGRAFLFFSYPINFSGVKPYVAVDGWTTATPLAIVAETPRGESAIAALEQAGYSFRDLLFGLTPGSIGETSTLACLLGLAVLLVTGVASWRIIAGVFLGGLAIAGGLTFFAAAGNPFYTLPPHWHLVMGSFAFGAIFMATDPVSAAATKGGKWIYGLLIGALIILIRVFNPAFPEGTMLAILFMNIFAPLVDHFVVKRHNARRARRVRF